MPPKPRKKKNEQRYAHLCPRPRPSLHFSRDTGRRTENPSHPRKCACTSSVQVADHLHASVRMHYFVKQANANLPELERAPKRLGNKLRHRHGLVLPLCRHACTCRAFRAFADTLTRCSQRTLFARVLDARRVHFQDAPDFLTPLSRPICPKCIGKETLVLDTY